MTAAPPQVTAFAPATVANVGSGFDVLGFAVERPGDTVQARRRDGGGVRLLEVTGDGGRLPRGADNTAVVAARCLQEKLGEPFGVDLVLHKGMPLASGLGSSAASAAAALYAVNRLAGDPLTAQELLPYALAAERVASGAGHADNAAPALMGGFVLIRSTAPLDLVRLPVPDGLAVALLSPDVEIPTEAARRILRKQIPLADAVSQWGQPGRPGGVAVHRRPGPDGPLARRPDRRTGARGTDPGLCVREGGGAGGRRHRLFHLRRRPGGVRPRRLGNHRRGRGRSDAAGVRGRRAHRRCLRIRDQPHRAAHRRAVLTGRPTGGY